MRFVWSMLGLAVGLAVGLIPLLPGARADGEREPFTRRPVDPQLLTKQLLRNLAIFYALPTSQQQAIRTLDRQLLDLPKAERDRLLRVMERYASWLEQLPAEQRRQVLAIDDPQQRLALIRQLRLKPWLDRQPKVRRDQLAAADPAQQAKLIDCWLDEELSQLKAWQQLASEWNELQLNHEMLTRGNPLPFNQPPFRKQLDDFVRESLLPRVSADEQQRLERAKQNLDNGNALAYARLILELTDRYPPVALPGPPTGPKTRQEVENYLARSLPKWFLQRPHIAQKEGRWPDYAIAIVEETRKAVVKMPMLLKQFGPSRLGEFSPGVQAFCKQELLPRLKAEEKKELESKEGLWPDYPQTLKRLAQAHNLVIPGTVLPGPRYGWDFVRSHTKNAGR